MSDHWREAEHLLHEWLHRARLGQHSHHEAGKHYRRVNYWFALPIVVVTTTMGTAAFATLAAHASANWTIVFGVASIAVAVLAALQTHLGYAERAEKHKNLGAQYGVVRRCIEAVLAVPYDGRGRPADVLDRIRQALDAIGDDSDPVPRRIFERTLRRLDGSQLTREAPRIQ